MSAKRKKPADVAPVQRICQATVAHLSEFYDGYVLIGFTAGERVPVVLHSRGEPVVDLALRALAANALMGNGDGE